MSSLTVVVPVYSGQDYLESLVKAVEAIREEWQADDAPVALVELIFVDDASIDGSRDVLKVISESRSWLTVLHLSRNFGQHAATIAGILHSSGDWVVTLDEDMQHPPERIEEMLLHAVREERDVVYARPISRAVHGKAWRDDSSRCFKRFMEWVTGNPTLHLVNSFRLMRGSIARATASVCSHNTYFDIALFWFTGRIAGLEMPLRDDRFAEEGKSGYNLGRLIEHAQKMLFSSQLRFLPLGLWIGAALFVLSLVASAYFFIMRLVAPNAIGVEGWTSLFVTVCMSAGLIAAMVGICLQYLSTLVLKAHGRPTFFTVDRSGDQALSDWLERRADQPKDTARMAARAVPAGYGG